MRIMSRLLIALINLACYTVICKMRVSPFKVRITEKEALTDKLVAQSKSNEVYTSRDHVNRDHLT